MVMATACAGQESRGEEVEVWRYGRMKAIMRRANAGDRLWCRVCKARPARSESRGVIWSVEGPNSGALGGDARMAGHDRMVSLAWLSR